MSRHCLSVVRGNDSPLAGRESQHLGIPQDTQAGFTCRLEVDLALPSQDTGNNVLTEVGVGLKSYSHRLGVCIRWRASSSFL